MAIDWLGELRALRGLISYEGVCTADGAAGGGTLVCSDLTLRPDYDGNLVVITSGDFIGQARDIDGATNLGTVTPHIAFGGQIVAGVEFLVVAIRTTPAEVAALTALVVALTADVADVETKLDLPAADSALAATIAQVLGNKASTAVYAKDNVSDVIRYLKGILDANISASGVADAGSGVGLIRDAARTEANDWWNGQTILMLTGAAAGQKRPITDFLAVTDDIIVAPNFDLAPGAGDVYVILAHYNLIVPRAADSALNALTSQVIGRKDDTIPAMNLAPAATWSTIRHLKAILERLGATPADPDDSLLTSAGQRDTAATLDDMSALDTANLHAKIRRVLLRMGTDAFSAVVFGVARTELDVMIFNLATYFVAAGGAYSATVDPGGAARTDIETTLTDLGAMLAGAAGITTWPAAAAPGDGISFAEAIRALYNLAATTGVVVDSRTDAADRITGETQIIEVSITAALNAGITTVATVTTQPCLIESVVIHADTAAHADMTTCAVEGGVGQVVEFIGVGDATEANLNAADKQVSWTGAVRFAAAKIIYIDLQGTGANAADLTITIKYKACADGGYLA